MEANQEDTDKKAAVWKKIKSDKKDTEPNQEGQAAVWKKIKRILTRRQLCGSKSRG